MNYKQAIIILLILGFYHSNAQNSLLPKTKHPQYLSLQWFGITFHPGGGSVFMRDNYPLRLDQKAYLVINLGLAASYDRELSKRFFLRGQAGFLLDCALQKSAYLHVGLQLKVLTLGRHSFSGGLGPMFLVREDWGKFPRYRRGDDFFGSRVAYGWQYRFFPIGGEGEYLYQINNKIQFQYSVIPAYPAVITSKMGFRMKF
jgi:hypothetical protein